MENIFNTIELSEETLHIINEMEPSSISPRRSIVFPKSKRESIGPPKSKRESIGPPLKDVEKGCKFLV